MTNVIYSRWIWSSYLLNTTLVSKSQLEFEVFRPKPDSPLKHRSCAAFFERHVKQVLCAISVTFRYYNLWNHKIMSSLSNRSSNLLKYTRFFNHASVARLSDGKAKSSAEVIQREKKVSANNYEPSQVVITRGEGKRHITSRRK